MDLLFASSGIEAEIVEAAEEIEIIPELRLHVARIGHLIVLKALAESELRPHDRADITALLEHATNDDLRLARESAGLVEERGYARGRRLVDRIDELLNRA